MRPNRNSRSKRLSPEAVRLDLGLAVSAALARPGVPRTQQEIADFCDCPRGTIHMIEQRALKKLRKSLHLRRDPLLQELLVGMFEERRSAEKSAIADQQSSILP